jgi:hypothetical protein
MMLSDLAKLTLFGVFGIEIFGACSCSNPQTTQTQRATITNAVASNAAIPPAAKQSNGRAFVRTYSVANLKDDSLDDCIDFTIRVAQPTGGDPEWASKDAPDLRAQLAKLGTEIRKPCTEQFADRVVLASCYAITKRDGQELQMVERYYNPATVGMEDLYMQECLRLGGTWEALAQDSPEFRKAKAEAKLRGLEALAAGSG